MPAPRKYPNELRERAKRLVQEARAQEGPAIVEIAASDVAFSSARCGEWAKVG